MPQPQRLRRIVVDTAMDFQDAVSEQGTPTFRDASENYSVGERLGMAAKRFNQLVEAAKPHAKKGLYATADAVVAAKPHAEKGLAVAAGIGMAAGEATARQVGSDALEIGAGLGSSLWGGMAAPFLQGLSEAAPHLAGGAFHAAKLAAKDVGQFAGDTLAFGSTAASALGEVGGLATEAGRSGLESAKRRMPKKKQREFTEDELAYMHSTGITEEEARSDLEESEAREKEQARSERRGTPGLAAAGSLALGAGTALFRTLTAAPSAIRSAFKSNTREEVEELEPYDEYEWESFRQAIAREEAGKGEFSGYHMGPPQDAPPPAPPAIAVLPVPQLPRPLAPVTAPPLARAPASLPVQQQPRPIAPVMAPPVAPVRPPRQQRRLGRDPFAPATLPPRQSQRGQELLQQYHRRQREQEMRGDAAAARQIRIVPEQSVPPYLLGREEQEEAVPMDAVARMQQADKEYRELMEEGLGRLNRHIYGE